MWRVPYPKFGDGPSFPRLEALSAHLGVNLATFGKHGAVVVGSNGKGSTAAMSAALLRQSGRPTGLFTSPHLFALNERFVIDGAAISDSELDTHWRRVKRAIDALNLSEKIGGFEFLFLIAASWFAARECVHTVWEAGIGGRFDPVRLIQAKRLALTSLDLEHTQLLGDTLEAIAQDKLDAAPRGARVFIGASCRGQWNAIKAHCGGHGVEPILVDGAALADVRAPFAGRHQQENAALALALVRDVCPLSDAQVEAAFAGAQWPGRLEVIEHDPLTVIDVGHTPAAIKASLEGFRAMQGGRRGVLVCGASRDKDVCGIISALAPGFDRIICASAHHKGAPADEVAAYAAESNPAAEVLIANSVADARQIAIMERGQQAIYVAGGLFLAAEYRAIHMGLNLTDLAFF